MPWWLEQKGAWHAPAEQARKVSPGRLPGRPVQHMATRSHSTRATAPGEATARRRACRRDPAAEQGPAPQNRSQAGGQQQDYGKGAHPSTLRVDQKGLPTH